MDEIIKSQKLCILLRSNYGNYIIQKAIKISPILIKMRFINIVIEQLDHLNDKKLMTKWRCVIDGIMQEYFVKNSWIMDMDSTNNISATEPSLKNIEKGWEPVTN